MVMNEEGIAFGLCSDKFNCICAVCMVDMRVFAYFSNLGKRGLLVWGI